MTKRERVQAALARQPVDRPPVAFWRHVPEVDHTSAGLAEAMLAFQRRWDLDLIKIMSSGVYCVEDWGCRVAYRGSPNGAKTCTQHAIRQVSDWAKLKPLDPGQGALGRELEALRLILAGREGDVPVLHTVFAPLTIARKLAGDRLLDFPMVPPKYTAEKGNQGMALKPVGTGPYRFVELVKDDRLVYRDLARAMVEDATWVFLLQQVDIYASRDRLSWTPRSDQWMPLHEAVLR